MSATGNVSHRVQVGVEKRAQARRSYGQAVLYSKLSPKDGEARIPDALAVAASALNWLEGTEFEDDAHRDLHEMGRYAREHFGEGCHLTWTGSQYEHRCPVVIAHKRFGFSIGFQTKAFLCSICGGDVSECEHLPGREYEVPSGPGPTGYCPVCILKECVEHLASQTYRVEPISILMEGEIEEISLVDRPRQPDARLTAVPIDGKRLANVLGKNFRPGMDVSCSQCLGPCPGFAYLSKGDADAEPP
jgi:hypothetical protein